MKKKRAIAVHVLKISLSGRRRRADLLTTGSSFVPFSGILGHAHEFSENRSLTPQLRQLMLAMHENCPSAPLLYSCSTRTWRNIGEVESMAGKAGGAVSTQQPVC